MAKIPNKEEIAFFLKVEHAAFKLRAHFPYVTAAEDPFEEGVANITIKSSAFIKPDFDLIQNVLDVCGLRVLGEEIYVDGTHDEPLTVLEINVAEAD